MFQIISPNMLKTYKSCPEKFYLKFVKGISVPVDDDRFTKGKNIHALASYYLKRDNIDKMETSLNEEEKTLWKFLKNNNYFKFEVVGTEYCLSVKVGGHFYGGRLDALVKDRERYFILDYKTGGVPKDAKYDYQTIIYLMAVSDFYKTDNVSFVYLDLKKEAETRIDLTQELYNEYKTKLITIGEKIDKLIFAPLKENCDNCEYRILCYDKKLSY